jgi:hypothetical protein
LWGWQTDTGVAASATQACRKFVTLTGQFFAITVESHGYTDCRSTGSTRLAASGVSIDPEGDGKCKIRNS